MKARIAAGSIFAGILALWLASAVLWRRIDDAHIPTPGRDSVQLIVVICIAVLICAAVGTFVATQRPLNAIGWILLGASFIVTFKAAAGVYTDFGYFVRHGQLPLWRWIAWISDWIWVFAIGSYGTFLFLLFPTGKPPSRRWWLVGALATIGILGGAGSSAFLPGPLDQFRYIRNPFPTPAWARPIVPYLGIGLGLMALSIALSVASLVVRARRGDSVIRHQIKWIAYAGFFVAIGFVNAIRPGPYNGFTVVPAIFLFGPIAAIAVAAAIAIQRYRLFEIDRLISRTASYLLVTTILGSTFALLVLVPTALLGSKAGTPSWLIATATLAVAVLFQPVRRRVQRTVDHRFNRERYDAVNTIESFASRLRDEIDMETLHTELASVITRTMQPVHVGLWLTQSKQS